MIRFEFLNMGREEGKLSSFFGGLLRRSITRFERFLGRSGVLVKVKTDSLFHTTIY